MYQCADAYHRDAGCVFVIGGHCEADACVGPATATRTPTRTRRATATPSRTKTRTKTRTPSLTPTLTVTATATQNNQPADTATASATQTATATGTATGTASATVTATGTSTTATQTPAPTGTATATTVSTVTVTTTPSATPTATPMCQMTPRSGCRLPMSPRSWVLFLRDTAGHGDRFVWKWRGVGETIEEFGDPLSTTSYAFCLYAGTNQDRIMQAIAPAGGTCGARSCWRQRGGRRYRYRNPDRTPEGVARIALRTRPSVTRASIVVAGKGENLTMPVLPLEQPLLAQLVQSDSPRCWESTFSAPASKNSKRQFRDKNDP
jgi:hypothetical protein